MLFCKLKRKGGSNQSQRNHAWKSIHYLCVFYLFISDNWLEKEGEKKTRKFHSNKHGLPRASLQKKRERKGRGTCEWVTCVCAWRTLCRRKRRWRKRGMSSFNLGNPSGEIEPVNMQLRQSSVKRTREEVGRKKKTLGWKGRKWFEVLISKSPIDPASSDNLLNKHADVHVHTW